MFFYLKRILSFFFIARTISRLLFERFLARMPDLQQLELIVSSGGSSNLLEGQQWELFITKYLPRLSIFNFKFKLINIDRHTYNEKNVLAQFCSPFWLTFNPGMYVSYNMDDSILYTVPHFAPRTIKHSLLSTLSLSTTLPVDRYDICYDQINELELDTNYKSSYRYTNVQRLIVSIATIDETLIDISKVEYLCVQSSSWSLKKLCQIIKKSMPHLHHLKIDCSFSFIQSSDLLSLEQIRILDLPQFSWSLNNNDIDLSSLFPCVTRLTIAVSDLHQMASLIDRCIHLSSGSFHISNSQQDGNYTLPEADTIHKWLIEKSSNFTYRLDSGSDIWIHIWISSENIQPKKVCYIQT
jgi:hypothetical protein